MEAKTGRAMSLELLLKKESSSEQIENPEILYGQANQSKKGEDFTFVKVNCERVTGEGVTPFSVFVVILTKFHFFHTQKKRNLAFP